MGGFRDFLMRGNVVELAVAVVIGAAFTGIVNAVVEGVINPVIGAFGTQNLDDYTLCLRGNCEPNEAGRIDGVAIHWGSVVSASLTFLITAAVVYFLMILPMNRFLARRRAKAPVETPAEPPVETELELLAQIRDELIAQRSGGATVGAQRTAPERGASLDKPSDGRP
ncbi:large conductance mechanosensitive channel protein MscL [Streptomyces sp. MS19]|uniref:large conductance mechanosensitive channel protein MscL n=1 Tax=Streptomyces sp. MS19 TaxID=3385972 RepID=UPI0039A2A7F4